MAGLMVVITKPLWGIVKLVFMCSVFCVLEGFISMVEKGFLGSDLIRNRFY